jgi:hypothetical protein
MSEDILSFEEHRRRRDENATLVSCARCGVRILATATTCSECGVHFQGEAQDYLHPSERPTHGHANLAMVLAIILVVTTVISALALL